MMEMEQERPVDCADVRDADLVQRYVAGTLDPPLREAFEEHYFACDACWTRLELALDVRAAFAGEDPARPGGADSTSTRRPLSGWSVAAVAAAAALLFGVVQVADGPESAPPAAGGAAGGAASAEGAFRGEIASFRFDASILPTGALEATWPAVPEADLYRVLLFDVEGELLTRRETADTTVRLRPPATDPPDAGTRGPLFLEVQALDPVRIVIARSGPERVRTGADR